MRRIALLALPLALVPAVGAHAQGGDPPAPLVADRLQLDGTGVVRADGLFLVFGLVQGPARLVAGDRGGDLSVRVIWRRTPRSRPVVRTGNVVTIGRGSARLVVSGSSLSLRVSARRTALSMAGAGMVRLRGDGTYRLNEQAAQPWDRGRWLIMDDDGDNDG